MSQNPYFPYYYSCSTLCRNNSRFPVANCMRSGHRNWLYFLTWRSIFLFDSSRHWMAATRSRAATRPRNSCCGPRQYSHFFFDRYCPVSSTDCYQYLKKRHPPVLQLFFSLPISPRNTVPNYCTIIKNGCKIRIICRCTAVDYASTPQEYLFKRYRIYSASIEGWS